MKAVQTALITGASSGIGEIFARKLASQGFNLIITARRAERLYKLAGELEDSHAVRVTVVPADLSVMNDIHALEGQIRNTPDLMMLVNNAGFGVHGSFVKSDPGRLQAMLDVHLSATVRLTHAALTVMKPKNEGTIINVSSVAGIIPVAGAVYSGTKSFLNIYSDLLQSELTHTNIRVQALCPGFTYSEFHDTEDYKDWKRSEVPRFLWLKAEKVVDYSLKMLAKNRIVVIPGMAYRFMARWNTFFRWFGRIMISGKRREA